MGCLLFPVGMEGILFSEEKVSQAEHRGFFSASPFFLFGHLVQVQGFFAQNFFDSLVPGAVFGKGVFEVLAQSFEGIADDVDPVPGGKVEVQLMRTAQKVHGHGEDHIIGEGEVVLQDGFFFVFGGESKMEGRLES